MTAIPSREVTTSQITSVGFSFYTDEEIRKLSVKQITSPMSLDNFKRPVPNGLYDLAMGPMDMMDACGTCGLKYRACPGHFGHIELVVPVYNPLVFRTLYKLLRCTCLHCYKFKMGEQEVERFAEQMAFLSEGRLVEAANTTTLVGSKAHDVVQGMMGKDGEEEDFSPKKRKAKAKGLASKGAETVHTIEAARDCHIQFFKHMPTGACANCRAHSPTIKAEGLMKIFQKPLDTKKAVQNQAVGVRIGSVLEPDAPRGDDPSLELETDVVMKTEEEDAKEDVKDMKENMKEDVKDEKDALVDEKSPDGSPQGKGGAEAPSQASQLRYMTPAEVQEIMRRMWAKNAHVLCRLYALKRRLASHGQRLPAPGLSALKDAAAFRHAYRMFFVQTVAVPPNNVRPPARMGDATFEHTQNVSLIQVLNANLDLSSRPAGDRELGEAAEFSRSIRSWLALQRAVNLSFDSSTADANAAKAQGIRQLLEKKEGLFRKNMMGKRVNFAARSVISPDPYLGSGEIGVPPYFAVRLSLPERVTPLNVQELREMVIRGASEHPGANAVEDENGRMVSLSHMPRFRREGFAKQLLSRQGTAAGGSGGKIVFRHLRDGDIMLTNRQPTLHKPGLMAHRARVLKGERTIRMHYANCATFNADFDGDEINLHLPQDYHGRAEGYEIVHADHQYIVPTDGKPIRGLIQDHVVAGVQLTKRDTFLSKAQFMQLVYGAVCPTRRGLVDASPIRLPPPAILKPRPLWTGKQVVTAVLARLTEGKAPLTLEANCKTTEKYWGKGSGEGVLIVHRGELVTGTMDKAQYGKFGLVHGVQELYGDKAAGDLLSTLSRLWTGYLQLNGFTCGISDLLLEEPAEATRAGLVAQAERRALSASAEFAGVPAEAIAAGTANEASMQRLSTQVQRALSERYRSAATTGAGHDRRATSSLQPLSSEVVDVCLSNGLSKPFPANCLSMMTVTGAKGSQVNFSQISCLLGQQELEGRRVPRMASGKTLPCFAPYDGGARSGGYVADRFLAGLAPQEYYFHCMAGREGLVDTTVKTSRSGYLQRCLVKNLESLRVHYDGTVRDNCDGSVVQFQYGEDSIDVLNSSFLGQLNFLANNADRLWQQQLPSANQQASKVAALGPMEKEAAKLNRWRQKQLSKQRRGKKAEDPNSRLPVSGSFFHTLLGVTSEKYADALASFIEKNEGASWLPRTLAKRKSEEAAPERWRDSFQQLMELRYLRALVPPGEAVGVIAAQSIGEPSTQMTLNTFHMAGRGEANVTLGIPRLRELFMTAAMAIKTPVMTLPLLPGKTKSDAESLASHLRSIRLAEVLEGISIEESIVHSAGNIVARQYVLRLKTFPESMMAADAQITFSEIKACFKTQFMRQLSAAVKKQLQQANASGGIQSMSVSAAGEHVPAAPAEEGEKAPARRSAKEDEDENAEENEEYNEGKLRFAGGRTEKQAMYDQGDQEDKEIAKEQQKAAEEREMTPEGEEGGEKSAMPEGKSPGAKEKALQYSTDNSVDEATSTLSATVTIPLSAPKVLMMELAERITTTSMIRHTHGIEKCYVIDGTKDPARPDHEPPPSVQTDGINFEGAWSFDETVDVNRLTTNDVGSILRTYGVEAARATLLREVSSVFGAYGIGVDQRHLGLIADFMTHQGGYRPCNRMGIESSTSPFLKITFETAAHFLTDATLTGAADDLSSPAARIVLGRVVELGTGAFELRQHLKADGW